MEPIKVNEKTHNILMQADMAIRQAQSNNNVILATLDVPKGWGYNTETRQFEPPKEAPVNG